MYAVCKYVCVYIRMYVCQWVMCMYTHNVYMCTYKYVQCVCVCANFCVYVYACVFLYY